MSEQSQAEQRIEELERALKEIRLTSTWDQACRLIEEALAPVEAEAPERGGPLANIRAEDGKWVTVSQDAWERLCEAVGADPRKGIREAPESGNG